MMQCPKCKLDKTPDDFYKSNGKFSTYCKVCHSQYVCDRFIVLKEKAIKYLGGKCADCNTSYPYYIYDFHHLDPAVKDVSWNHLRKRSWRRIQAELDRCVLLCANCHRFRHYS